MSRAALHKLAHDACRLQGAACRHEVVLRFLCVLVPASQATQQHPGDAAQAKAWPCHHWLTAAQAVHVDGGNKVLAFLQRCFDTDTVPLPGRVGAMFAGLPCQELSGSNAHAPQRGILNVGNVRAHLHVALQAAMRTTLCAPATHQAT